MEDQIMETAAPVVQATAIATWKIVALIATIVLTLGVGIFFLVKFLKKRSSKKAGK